MKSKMMTESKWELSLCRSWKALQVAGGEDSLAEGASVGVVVAGAAEVSCMHSSHHL